MAQQFTLNQSPDVHPFLSTVSKADATLKSQGNISLHRHMYGRTTPSWNFCTTWDRLLYKNSLCLTKTQPWISLGSKAPLQGDKSNTVHLSTGADRNKGCLTSQKSMIQSLQVPLGDSYTYWHVLFLEQLWTGTSFLRFLELMTAVQMIYFFRISMHSWWMPHLFTASKKPMW